MTRILVVDDLEANRYLLEATLRSYGFDVVSAHDGVEALAAARREPPDLVITDILMPVMDGFALCRQWRADERLRRIPFLFYTATYTDPKDEQLALDLGADRFVPKPQEPQVLIEIVRDLLARGSAAASSRPAKVLPDEVVTLREYNEALVRKLEKKVHDLEATQQQLRDDIRQRRLAEASWRQSEARWRSIIETEPECVKLLAADGSLTQMNPAGLRLIEADSFEQMGGRCVYPLIAPGHRAQFEEHVARVFRGESCQLEFQLIGLKGGRYWLETHATPLRSEQGEVVSLLAVTRNITAQKQAEAQRLQLEAQLRQSQKMEAIGTLAGGIAHDFNNLLCAILGNVGLATHTLDPGHAATESLNEIVKAAQRAKALVSQILAFGRPAAPQTSVLDLASILVEDTPMVRSVLPAGVALVTDIADDVPKVVADATEIHQVLLNLCTNAWQAMAGRPGEITVRLDGVRVDADMAAAPAGLRPGRFARLTVCDTGKGMDAATKERIFEPFFTTKQPGVGTGLGLSVVHGIMKSHEGTILVHSQPGQGTRIELWFPAATGAAPAVAAPVKNRTAIDAAPVQGHGQFVLYLDDEAPLVTMATMMLKRLGYQVAGFTRMDEAVAAFQANPDAFDLVVTDYNMPDASGLSVARAVTAVRPGLPVMLTSGFITDTIRSEAAAAGVRQLLAKPYSMDELLRAVQQLVH